MKFFVLLVIIIVANTAQGASGKRQRNTNTPADLAIQTFKNGRSQIGGCLGGANGVRYCDDGSDVSGKRARR